MKIKRILEIPLLTGLLLVFLLFTDPNKISLPFIVVPYILGALIVYRILFLLLVLIFKHAIKEAKLKLYSLIATTILVNFALLKSIGQITIQDALISGAIMIISIVYINKFSLSS